MGNINRLSLALALMAAITFDAQAQTSLFRYNTLLYNPGYTGFAGTPALGLNAQVFGLTSEYRQVQADVTYDVPVKALHGGIGVLANSFHIGEN